MSLQKNLISVPITGGIDTKTTSKLVESGFFLNLRNTVRRKKGAIEKRFGFTSLGNEDTEGTEITSGQKLDTFFNDLILIDDFNLYSYLAATDSWANRGPVVPTSVTSESVISSTGVSVMADSDAMEGLECYAWEDSRGGIRCSVIDVSTGTSIIADREVSATGTRPKVAGIGSSFCVTYVEGSDFKVRRVTVGDPSTLIAAQTIEAGITDFPYDLTVYGDREYGVFAYNTATAVRVGFLLSTGVVGNLLSSGLADPVDIALLGQNAVNIVADSENNLLYILFHDSAGASSDDLRCVVLTVPTLVQIDADDLEAGIANVRNITGVVQSSGTVTVYYEVSGGTADVHKVRVNTVICSAGASVIGAAADFKLGVGLASKAFITNDTVYVGLVHESTLQSTYFVAQSAGRVVARMQGSTAAGLTRSTAGVLRSGLPRVSCTDMERTIALAVKSRLTTIDSTVAAAFVGINRQTIEFNNSQFDTGLLGLNLHIAGGVVTDYDGVSVVEHGFHLYPERVTGAASNGAGALTVSGVYRLKVLYEWVDAQGQIHRSAPSVAVSVTMGGSDDTITVTAPTLRLTSKTAVKIIVYRTKFNETTVFYRDAETANNAAADTVSITLLNADAVIAVKEVLYTVGGTLDNISPPSCTVSHSHKNRLWLAGTEDGDIWYSRQQVKGEGVFFSDGLKVRLPDVTAVETLDDKVVFFQDRLIYTLVGDGPVDTGAQNDYGVPQLVPGDVGCTNQKSLISTPIGLMFKSAKGIYLLDGTLKPAYIGDRVEEFNDLTISSAVLLKDNNEVRFTTTDGVCLVYNYYFNEWSTFTNYEAISATVFLNDYCHLTEAGLVNREVENQYNDNGVIYSMRIETNWFQFAKLQGFQRLYYWGLLGDFVSDHICRVKLAYDFEDYYTDPVLFNTVTGMAQTEYGTGLYGAETPYGGGGSEVFQFRSKPERQKCQSFKMLIEDVDTISDAGGGSFKLVALSFLIGSKRGLFKMSESKTKGI